MLLQVMPVSYLIRYTASGASIRRKKMNGYFPAAAVVCLVVLTAAFLLSDTCRAFVGELLPWTRPEVQEAVGELCEDIRQGRSLWEAAEVFCREVLYGTEAYR